MKRRRLHAVRLTDVPLQQRYTAAQQLARRARTPMEAAALLEAAVHPSRRVYFVIEHSEAA